MIHNCDESTWHLILFLVNFPPKVKCKECLCMWRKAWAHMIWAAFFFYDVCCCKYFPSENHLAFSMNTFQTKFIKSANSIVEMLQGHLLSDSGRKLAPVKSLAISGLNYNIWVSSADVCFSFVLVLLQLVLDKVFIFVKTTLILGIYFLCNKFCIGWLMNCFLKSFSPLDSNIEFLARH